LLLLLLLLLLSLLLLILLQLLLNLLLLQRCWQRLTVSAAASAAEVTAAVQGRLLQGELLLVVGQLGPQALAKEARKPGLLAVLIKQHISQPLLLQLLLQLLLLLVHLPHLLLRLPVVPPPLSALAAVATAA
jgi:hypothetical protein